MKIIIIPSLALVISLVVTSVIWWVILDFEKKSQEAEFIGFAEKLTLQIKDRLETHEQILAGFDGLFVASAQVTPEEYVEFFEVQRISERFPEIQGVGYIKHLGGEEEKIETINELSEFGIKYSIFPEGVRQDYYPVVFLEPRDVMNQRAIGYDIYTEETRKQAVEKSKEVKGTVITGKLILVQETEQDIQNGFLMLLPIYLHHYGTEPSEFKGFVYSVFRMNDFVNNLLGNEIFESVEIKIYDGVESDETRFFSSHYVKANPIGRVFDYSQELEFGERVWVISYLGVVPNSQNFEDIRIIIPIAGYSMSFLLFYTLLLLSRNYKLNQTIIKKERTSALGELAARFSHDIRNPLSNIQLALGILKKKQMYETKEDKEKIDIIERNLDRISHQVEDVLDFVRIHPLRKKTHKLKPLLSETLESIIIPATIKTSLHENNVSVFGDSDQLQVVFRNLIINAIQELNGNGQITIKAKEEPAKTIIEFIDSGQGFSGIDKDEIFNLLSTTKQTGTGLGLVTCKNIIQNHRGTIKVKENPTTFTITLPKR